MARPNKFFSFALLISLITFSSTSFLTADGGDDKSGILNKENESQLGLNSSTEDENKEEQGGSYLPSLPGLPSIPMKKAIAARTALPMILAAGLPSILPVDATKPLGNIIVKSAQGACLAVFCSTFLPKNISKFVLNNGLKVSMLLPAVAAGLDYAPLLNPYIVAIKKVGPLLVAKDDGNIDYPEFTAVKIAALGIGAVIVSPYLSKAIKATAKKLGYIEKSQKEEPTTN